MAQRGIRRFVQLTRFCPGPTGWREWSRFQPGHRALADRSPQTLPHSHCWRTSTRSRVGCWRTRPRAWTGRCARQGFTPRPLPQFCAKVGASLSVLLGIRQLAARGVEPSGDGLRRPLFRIGGGTIDLGSRDGLRRPGNRDGGGPRIRSRLASESFWRTNRLVARLLDPEPNLILDGEPVHGFAGKL